MYCAVAHWIASGIATMNGEFLAPARRVSFFLWQDTFDQLRPEGLALFRAAVLWAVSPPE
jgi:hypothetical protein